ncbi:MAG TPA: two-component regulator propeller domain-containing protein, partial [Pyrinomonadaceae bacterium]|nr:two-component regulator propeller domain-containing protein [Pyrinomonadaceae bacterium]
MKKLPDVYISSARLFFVADSTHKLNRGGLVRRLRWACLLFALLCSPAAALERDQPLAQLYHTTWNERDGLSGAVTALAQTTDGFLWVGTTGGLFRFDGLRFESYMPGNGPLPSVSVSALMAVPDGALWVGYTRGGASLLKDGRSTNYSEREGFPVGRVRSFARDLDGNIWAGVVGSFTRFDGSRWEKIRDDWNYPSKSAWTLLVDAQGTLWAPTGKGIMFLPRGERSFRDAGLETGPVMAFAQAPDGTMFFHDNGPGQFQ